MARLIFHSCAPWSPSGYGSQCSIWSRQLREMGHEVFVSTYWGLNGSPTQWDGLTILPAFGGNYASPSLQQHARHIDPDLVITLGDVWVMDPGVLKELPVAHWLPADCRPMSTADRNVAEAGGASLIAMSRFGLERFRDAGFGNALLVPHGIDFGTWTIPEDKAALRKAAGISESTYVIGVNAANNDALRKAPAEMLLAFAKFLRSRPDSLLWLHTAVHCDGGQDLEFLAESLGITDRVRVVDQYRYNAGLIQPADLRDWYGCLDVLLASTYAEGFGLPIVEAMACGVPVITTRCSSMEELNPDGIQVDGEPFYNGVHKAWWIRPFISGMVTALEQSYEQRRDVDQVKLRESVASYEVGNVAEKHMGPAVDELLARMAARRSLRLSLYMPVISSSLPVLYLMAPMRLYGTPLLEAAREFPFHTLTGCPVRLLVCEDLYRGNREWFSLWPEVRRQAAYGVFLDHLGGWVARGTWAETAELMALGRPVWWWCGGEPTERFGFGPAGGDWKGRYRRVGLGWGRPCLSARVMPLRPLSGDPGTLRGVLGREHQLRGERRPD